MAQSTCTIDGCEKPQKHRSWCGMHYQRWQRHGTPHAKTIPRYASLRDAWEANTQSGLDSSGCLLWSGGATSAGYGLINAQGESKYAHRYAWERAHGPIPEGSLVDHTCHIPRCVNIDHLRLASKSENGQNRSGAPNGATTGVRGVTKRRGGYRVRVSKAGVHYYGGTFSTVEEAARVAEKMRADIFGDFAGR